MDEYEIKEAMTVIIKRHIKAEGLEETYLQIAGAFHREAKQNVDAIICEESSLNLLEYLTDLAVDHEWCIQEATELAEQIEDAYIDDNQYSCDRV